MLNGLPRQVELRLEGKIVGRIDIHRFADSWFFGDFHPTRDFSEFAALFGEWSLLLHADDNEPKVSRTALDELAKIERAIDALHAELIVPESGHKS